MVKDMLKKILFYIRSFYLKFIIFPLDFIVGLLWRLMPLKVHIKYYENNFSLKPGNDNIICIFAHYDKHNYVDDYVIYYLKELKKQLNATIVFVSNSKKLYDEDIVKIRQYCDIIVVRCGRGRDFGSYYLGFKLIEKYLDNCNYIIFCNDSVYGPFKVRIKQDMFITLKDVFITLKDFQFSGITDSFEHSYHIQSYFVIVRKDIFDLLKKFWRKYVFLQNKWFVIKRYEIGLSNFLKKRKVKIGAYATYFDITRKVSNKYLQPTNPTHFYWDFLIKNLSVPFIKIELLRDNPSKISNVHEWIDVVSNFTDYDVNLILNHLKRVK